MDGANPGWLRGKEVARMTMGTMRINVPEDLFGEGEDETPTTKRAPSALETYLGRKRDPNTGELVPKKKRKPRTIAASTFARAEHETRVMIESRDWEACAMRHLVALYAIMHEKTYGIAPETSATERHTMTLQMGGFVKRAFGGDMEKAVEYFRWLWWREIKNEKWRRENGRLEGRRLGFRACVSNAILDDYRVAMARRKDRGDNGTR